MKPDRHSFGVETAWNRSCGVPTDVESHRERNGAVADAGKLSVCALVTDSSGRLEMRPRRGGGCRCNQNVKTFKKLGHLQPEHVGLAEGLRILGACHGRTVVDHGKGVVHKVFAMFICQVSVHRLLVAGPNGPPIVLRWRVEDEVRVDNCRAKLRKGLGCRPH